MKEISNKVLMYVLFVAVVVSVGSMMYTFGAISKTTTPTGMAVDAGTVDVVIAATYVVNLTDTTINYGSGSLTDGHESCLLNSTDTGAPAECWTNSTAYAADPSIAYENIGSNTIDVDINGTAAADFIGGVGATFVADCVCGGNAQTDVDIEAAHAECCGDLPSTGSDTGTLVTQLNVVAGSSTGTANLIFYGTQI